MADIAKVGREHACWSVARAGLHQPEVQIVANHRSVSLTLMRQHEHADGHSRTVRPSVDSAGSVGKSGPSGIPAIRGERSKSDVVSPKGRARGDDGGARGGI
jgi:hypothetical protein